MVEVSVEKLVKILDLGEKREVSDIHLVAEEVPIFRIRGELVKVHELERVTSKEIREMVEWSIDDEQRGELKREKQLDFSFAYGSEARYRANIHKEKGQYSLVLRVINNRAIKLKELNLPKIVGEFKNYSKGLVLVTGPTGSGKSTTLTGIIEEINESQGRNIITIEDPIEYIYENKRSIIRQREIGKDMNSFSQGLKSLLRQDPDVILLGELRDYESVETALMASETGHLVFATLHTSGVVETIDRVIDVFPSEKQKQARAALASNLRAVISQRLVKGEERRYCATEILINNISIRNLILTGKNIQIHGAMELGKREGMRSMKDSLEELYSQGKITLSVMRDELL